MLMRGSRWVFLAALLFVLAAAIPASAQVTGTVAGSLKDAQGGVMPGATVTLVSETRGTKLPPVVTAVSGDFVFPNVPSDTYTLEVTMTGFKTLKRTGIAVSPADRVVVPTLSSKSADCRRPSKSKASRPSSRRRAASGRSPSRPIRSRTCRFPVAASPRSRRSRRASPARAASATVLDRRRQHNVMMDGVSTMDTGSNRPARRDERRVDRGSESAHVELSGRVRPVERPADHGRHQERHEPVPRIGL